MRVPIGLLGQSFIDTIIEVFVMREDYMATNIVQLQLVRTVSNWLAKMSAGTYESLRSDVGRRQTARRLVGVDDKPRCLVLKALCISAQRGVRR